MPSAGSERRLEWPPPIVVAVLCAATLLMVGLGSLFGWFDTVNRPTVVVLYCFSTLDDVMKDRLLPAFRERWQREQGETVEFVVTFAGSGDITDRILTKYPAEIAVVSSELDAYRLPAPWESWRELPYNGIVAKTPLVIVVRKGNPKNIRDFEDLSRPGIELLHGDPATSGAAELAILAEYGSALRRGGDSELAFQQLLGIWKNVTAKIPTAREARNRFESGEGDALVTYEEDVLGSPSRARIEGEIVYQVSTIVAEPVVVKIEKNIDARQPKVFDAFIEFLWTREAQQILVDYGFQSVDEELNTSRGDLATIEDPFTLTELGGATARRDLLDRVWRDRVVPELRR